MSMGTKGIGNGGGSGAGAALAPREAKEPATFPALLEQAKPEIAKILPDGLDVNRVARVALTAYRMDPKIQNCTPLSILSCVMKACELGLEPGGAMNHAYLIPYGNECTFRVSYFGYLELARRSGEFRLIEARVVHLNDVFDYEYNPDLVFRHKPNLLDPGPSAGAYVYAKLANGEVAVEWMPKVELDKVAALPKAGPVWKGPFREEMERKTVLRRFLKKQRLSAHLAEAIDRDRDDDEGSFAHPREATAREATVSRSAALAARLALPPAEAQPEDEDQSAGVAYEDEAPKPGREPGEDDDR